MSIDNYSYEHRCLKTLYFAGASQLILFTDLDIAFFKIPFNLFDLKSISFNGLVALGSSQ